MTGQQTFPGLTRHALEEHQQVHFYLDQLERGLKGIESEPAEVETLRRLAAQIEGLEERLREHFEGESGGLFRAVQDILPDVRGELQRLSGQHAQLLEMLEMARTRAQWGEPSEAGVLKAELEAFLKAVREHERREEALLTRALERDRQR